MRLHAVTDARTPVLAAGCNNNNTTLLPRAGHAAPAAQDGQPVVRQALERAVSVQLHWWPRQEPQPDDVQLVPAAGPGRARAVQVRGGTSRIWVALLPGLCSTSPPPRLTCIPITPLPPRRFLWQLQYLVAQGFYVLLDFSSTREAEPNVSNPALLAENWGNLWRIMSDIPAYKSHMAGRVFPDLVNEPSRWGCQWNSACADTNGTRACAPALQFFGTAAAAIWRVDPSVPIFINGLGQDNSTKWDQCGNYYPGMHWGDGFITNKAAVQQYGISDPSAIFTTAFTKSLGPFISIEEGKAQVGPGAFAARRLCARREARRARCDSHTLADGCRTAACIPLPQMSRLVLSPHIYPHTITGDPNKVTASMDAITYRWDQSWGWKMEGTDKTSDVSGHCACAAACSDAAAQQPAKQLVPECCLLLACCTCRACASHRCRS